MYMGELQQPTQTTPPSWLTSAMGIGQSLVQIKQQSDLRKVNMQRLQSGLPPIEAGDLAAQVKVGMDSAQLNRILMAAGGIAVLVTLLVMIRRRR